MISVAALQTKRRWIFLFFFIVIVSCAPRRAIVVYPPREVREKRTIPPMGFTIQVGAFSQVENAVRLAAKLKSQGLDATYFKAGDGLFKVRFGNFVTHTDAIKKAQEMKERGIIEEFYIVNPREYAVSKRFLGEGYIREELVKTARSFLGVPYLWGGTDADRGFDCSGLSMTVYQLNGFDLPRTSQEQASYGQPVSRDRLSKGDLVFFDTKNQGRVSHVGIYIGDNLFIHAPGRGKRIRIDSLEKDFYRSRYVGARSYI